MWNMLFLWKNRWKFKQRNKNSSIFGLKWVESFEKVQHFLNANQTNAVSNWNPCDGNTRTRINVYMCVKRMKLDQTRWALSSHTHTLTHARDSAFDAAADVYILFLRFVIFALCVCLCTHTQFECDIIRFAPNCDTFCCANSFFYSLLCVLCVDSCFFNRLIERTVVIIVYLLFRINQIPRFPSPSE